MRILHKIRSKFEPKFPRCVEMNAYERENKIFIEICGKPANVVFDGFSLCNSCFFNAVRIASKEIAKGKKSYVHRPNDSGIA